MRPVFYWIKWEAAHSVPCFEYWEEGRWGPAQVVEVELDADVDVDAGVDADADVGVDVEADVPLGTGI